MTPADEQFIIKSLGKHFVFGLLNEANRYSFMSNIRIRKRKKKANEKNGMDSNLFVFVLNK